jgi:hypothetical protein
VSGQGRVASGLLGFSQVQGQCRFRNSFRDRVMVRVGFLWNGLCLVWVWLGWIEPNCVW